MIVLAFTIFPIPETKSVHLFFAFSALFCGIQFVCPMFLDMLYPSWWRGLSPKKKSDIPPNVAALFHHCCVVPFGIYYTCRYRLVDGGTIGKETLEYLVPFILGYFFSDITFYALPEAFNENRYEYLLHHVFGIIMNLASLQVPANNNKLLAFCSSCLISEFSNIFFITGWILRATPLKTSKIISYLNIVFAILFFFLRNIHLTYHSYVLWDEFNLLGIFFKWGAMFPVLVMQFWWLHKIILQVTGTKTNKAVTDSEEDSKAVKGTNEKDD